MKLEQINRNKMLFWSRYKCNKAELYTEWHIFKKTTCIIYVFLNGAIKVSSVSGAFIHTDTTSMCLM